VPIRPSGCLPFLENSAEFWLGLQVDYDLDQALDAHGDDIQRDVQPFDA